MTTAFAAAADTHVSPYRRIELGPMRPATVSSDGKPTPYVADAERDRIWRTIERTAVGTNDVVPACEL